MAKNDLEAIGMENLTEFCGNCGWFGPTEHTRIVDEDTVLCPECEEPTEAYGSWPPEPPTMEGVLYVERERRKRAEADYSTLEQVAVGIRKELELKKSHNQALLEGINNLNKELEIKEKLQEVVRQVIVFLDLWAMEGDNGFRGDAAKVLQMVRNVLEEPSL